MIDMNIYCQNLHWLKGLKTNKNRSYADENKMKKLMLKKGELQKKPYKVNYRVKIL